MGNGIAHCFAQSGYRNLLTFLRCFRQALLRLKNLDRMVAGKILGGQKKYIDNISIHRYSTAVKGMDFVEAQQKIRY